MPITQKQRDRRRHSIGASDAAAIMNRDPWRNAADVYYSKVEKIDVPENDAMRRGTLLEPGIIQWAADELGVRVRRNVYRRKGVRHANLDAAVCGQDAAIEAKTSSDGAGWGEAGTDQVPEHVLWQVHHQMDVADLQRAYVAVLLPRLEFRLYIIDRCEELCSIVREACERFWADHVVPRKPPELVIPSPDTLALIPRQRVCVQLTQEFAAPLTTYQQLGCIERRVKELRGNAKSQVIHALGNADEGVLPDGRVFTYHEDRRGRRAARVRCPSDWTLPAVSETTTKLLTEIESDDEDAE